MGNQRVNVRHFLNEKDNRASHGEGPARKKKPDVWRQDDTAAREGPSERKMPFELEGKLCSGTPGEEEAAFWRDPDGLNPMRGPVYISPADPGQRR